MKPSTRVFVTAAFCIVTVALGETLFEADARAVSSANITPGTIQAMTLLPGTLILELTPSFSASELLILLPGFTFSQVSPNGTEPYSAGLCGSTPVGVTLTGPTTSSAVCAVAVVGGVSQFYMNVGSIAAAGVPITVEFASRSLTSQTLGPLTTVTTQLMSGVSIIDDIDLTIVLTAPPEPAPAASAPPAASPTLTPTSAPWPVVATVPSPQSRQLAATGGRELPWHLYLGTPALFLAGLIFLMSRKRLRRGDARLGHNSIYEAVSESTKPGRGTTTNSRRGG